MMNKMPEDIVETDDVLSPAAGYAAWAPLYDGDGNPLIALEGPAVHAMFGDLRGRTALDLGCGTGRHTLALVEAGARVAALDQSREMMRIARTKLRGRDVSWSRHALPAPMPFARESFDLAVMGLVAEHIEALSTVLEELHRLVKPGGRLILSALHPDRTAGGQRARFIDPATGLRRPIATIHRETSEYREIASTIGWELASEISLVVSASIVDQYPRAVKYAGMPLGWVGCWDRRG